MRLTQRLGGIMIAILITASMPGLGACGAALGPPTSTPTGGPVIMCTAPACWEDEVYSCEDYCPGGCGTRCATPTPDPRASPTPTIPPFASICVMPTAVPGTPAPGMALCTAPESVHVGDTVQVAAEINSLERPDSISITGFDMDGAAGYFTARARTGGHTATALYVGSHPRPERIQSDGNRLLLIFTAVSAGPVKIDFKLVPTMPETLVSITITVLP
jgi:hypothetical protein